MFRAPQEACRGCASTHSSQPDEEEEGWTSRELCGAPTVSQKQTKHTPVSLPPEMINTNVFWCAARLKVKGAATFVKKKEAEHGFTASYNTTEGRHNPTNGAADQSVNKKFLFPTQDITFIGLSLDSVALRVRLSAQRVEAFRACPTLFHRRTRLKFRICLRLALALTVISLGHLHMRPFQQWVASLNLNLTCHGQRQVFILMACILGLHPWGHTTFLSTGVTMGTILSRKVISTDASLVGWGATCEVRITNGT